MNQEKLAKLQAQVRIGGKVRCSKPLLGICMHVCSYVLSIVLYRGQHAERRRLFTEQLQQMTRSFSSP